MKEFSESMYLDNKYQHSTKGLFNMIPFSINSFFLIFLPFLYFIVREKIIIIYQKEISIDLIVSFFWIMLFLLCRRKEVFFLYIAHQDIRQDTPYGGTGGRRNLCC